MLFAWLLRPARNPGRDPYDGGMASEDDTGRARSYRKAADRREQVLAKAIELFAEHGVEASLRSIGDAIGVSPFASTATPWCAR